LISAAPTLKAFRSLTDKIAPHLTKHIVEIRKNDGPAADSESWRSRTTPPDYRDRHLCFTTAKCGPSSDGSTRHSGDRHPETCQPIFRRGIGPNRVGAHAAPTTTGVVTQRDASDLSGDMRHWGRSFGQSIQRSTGSRGVASWC